MPNVEKILNYTLSHDTPAQQMARLSQMIYGNSPACSAFLNQATPTTFLIGKSQFKLYEEVLSYFQYSLL